MKNIEILLKKIDDKLKIYQWNLYDEKTLQEQLDEIILKDLGFVREYKLDSRSIIDFYHEELNLGIEIKIKGQVTNIFRQCKRYAKNEKIETLVLITSIAMNLPETIENKKSYVLRIGSSWL
jgi:hypothetical protein